MWDWLKALWNKAIAAFRSFISLVFTSAKKVVIGQLKDFAIKVVTDINITDLSDEDKRKKAFLDIKDEAIRRGMNVKDSLINLLIEMAVQYIKNVSG